MFSMVLSLENYVQIELTGTTFKWCFNLLCDLSMSKDQVISIPDMLLFMPQVSFEALEITKLSCSHSVLHALGFFLPSAVQRT